MKRFLTTSSSSSSASSAVAKKKIKKDRLKIVSWNVNGVRAFKKRAETDSSKLKTFLKSESPDVICLQETKIDDTLVDDFRQLFGNVAANKDGF